MVTVELKYSQLAPKYIAEKLYRRLIIIHAEFYCFTLKCKCLKNLWTSLVCLWIIFSIISARALPVYDNVKNVKICVKQEARHKYNTCQTFIEACILEYCARSFSINMCQCAILRIVTLTGGLLCRKRHSLCRLKNTTIIYMITCELSSGKQVCSIYNCS